MCRYHHLLQKMKAPPAQVTAPGMVLRRLLVKDETSYLTRHIKGLHVAK